MKKRYISMVISGLLMISMVSCSNNSENTEIKEDKAATERIVEDINLEGSWNQEHTRDEVQQLHEEILERVENACIIYELQDEYSLNEEVKDENGTTVNRNGLYLEIPDPEANRIESMTYELVQYGADLASGKIILKVGFNLDKDEIKEAQEFSFETTAISTFSEAVTGVDDRDYTELNEEIYDAILSGNSISKIENNLDGLLETITITDDYLLYTLETKEYNFK